MKSQSNPDASNPMAFSCYDNTILYQHASTGQLLQEPPPPLPIPVYLPGQCAVNAVADALTAAASMQKGIEQGKETPEKDAHCPTLPASSALQVIANRLRYTAIERQIQVQKTGTGWEYPEPQQVTTICEGIQDPMVSFHRGPMKLLHRYDATRFRLVGALVHIPSETGTGGHFVFWDCIQHPFDFSSALVSRESLKEQVVHVSVDRERAVQDRLGGEAGDYSGTLTTETVPFLPLSSPELWKMLVLLRTSDEEAEGDDPEVVFIPCNAISPPFGMGEANSNNNVWDSMDWAMAIAEEGFSVRGDRMMSHFYKGGQYMGKGTTFYCPNTVLRAPKGGGHYYSERFGDAAGKRFAGASRAIGAVGIAYACYSNYQDGYSVKASVGHAVVSYGIGWGASEVATGCLLAVTGSAGLPVLIAASVVGMGASYLYDSGACGRLGSAISGWWYGSESKGAGIAGGGGDDDDDGGSGGGGGGGSGPGGVDLRRVPRLEGFANDACLYSFSSSAMLHVFFPLSIQWSSIDACFKQRLMRSIRVSSSTTSTDTRLIPWLILQEVCRCRAFGVPLLFSLHFQKSSEVERLGGAEDMYSVMHPMLRKMFIGHILGLLDVFLKGYLNGGTYTESFILEYEERKKSNGGSISLEEGMIDLHKDLVGVRKSLEERGESTAHLPEGYVCLRDLIDLEVAGPQEGETLNSSVGGNNNNKEKNVSEQYYAEHYSSAFRILGTLKQVHVGGGNILEPVGAVEVEADLNIKPSLSGELTAGIVEKKDSKSMQSHSVKFTAHEKMRREVRENMTRHPRFAPYFEMLKMIAFCAALVDAFHDAGVHPSYLSRAIGCNASSLEKDQCSGAPPKGDIQEAVADVTANLRSFPVCIPPLPIRRGEVVTVEVRFRDLMKTLAGDPLCEKLLLHKMLLREDLHEIPPEERAKRLRAGASLAVKRLLMEKHPQYKSTIDILDDGALRAEKIAAKFRGAMDVVILQSQRLRLEAALIGRCAIFGDDEPPVINPEEIENLVNGDQLPQLISYARSQYLPRWERETLARLERMRTEALRELLAKLPTPSSIRQKVQRAVNEALREGESELEEQCRRSLGYVNHSAVASAKREMEANYRSQGERNVQNALTQLQNTEAEIKRKVEENHQSHLKNRQAALDSLEKVVNDSEERLRDPVGHYLSNPDEHEGLNIVLDKFRMKIGFTDVPSTSDVVLGVMGGCGLREKQVPLMRTGDVVHRHKEYCDEKNLVLKGGRRLNQPSQSYFQLDIPLSHYLGDSMEFIYLSHGSCQEKSVVQRALTVFSGADHNSTTATGDSPAMSRDAEEMDAFGRHAGHYVGALPRTSALSFLQSIPSSLVNRSSEDGQLPIHIACSAGNLEAVQALIKAGADVNAVLPSGLSPLLIACQENHHAIAVLLLKSGCSNVNQHTQTEVTPLHWAVIHDDPALIAELVACGRESIKLHPRRSDSATPVHIAARMGLFQSLQVLLQAFPDSPKLRMSDGRTPLHLACLGNHVDCAVLLVQRGGAKEDVLTVQDNQKWTPFTLSISLGHTSLAIAICRAAGVKMLQSLTRHLSRERAQEIAEMIASMPLLAAYLSIQPSTQQSTFAKDDVVSNVSEVFSKEKILRECTRTKNYNQLLLQCVESRDPDSITRVALYAGGFSTDAQKLLLRQVAAMGLHNWPRALANCGVDVCLPDVDGCGHDLLALAAQAEDVGLMKAVWFEMTRFAPKSALFTLLVEALCDAPVEKSTTLIRTFVELKRSIQTPPAEGAADPLLRSAVTTREKWTFARRQLEVQPSREAIIAAAVHCRPSLLLCLLGEGTGADGGENLWCEMVLKASDGKRKDNMYVLMQHCWPSVFSAALTTPYSKQNEERWIDRLPSRIQCVVSCRKMFQFIADVKEQETILNSTLQTQDVNETDANTFCGRLIQRNMLPLPNQQFGLHAWLIQGGTTKVPCPWNPNLMDDRGLTGYVCACGSIIRTPWDALRIAESMHLSLEKLLIHPAFLDAMQIAASPLELIKALMEDKNDITVKGKQNQEKNRTLRNNEVLAACLAALTTIKSQSYSMWEQLVQAKPQLKEKLVNLLDIVIEERNQVTLFMQLLPLPYASCLVDEVLKNPKKELLNALKKRDRYGRSAAHYLMNRDLSSAEAECDGMTRAIHIVLTDRLKRIIPLYPPLLHQQDREGFTVFTLAAQKNNVSALAYLATCAPTIVLERALTQDGRHALHLAVTANARDAVQMMLSDFCMNPNVRTVDVQHVHQDSQTALGKTEVGLTPLHFAAKENNVSLFRLLLNAGADPTVRNDGEETPIHWALKYGGNKLFKVIRNIPGFWILGAQGELLLPLAANKQIGTSAFSQVAKLSHPNRAKRSRTRKTALLEAVRLGNTSVVHQLFLSGADLLAVDEDQWNAIHFASVQSHTAILVQLLQYATLFYPKQDVERLLVQSTSDGDTPLHLAALHGSQGCVVQLLSYDCVREASCIRVRNHSGLTAANVAALGGHHEVALWLLAAAGGRVEISDLEGLEPATRKRLQRFWSAVTPEEHRRAKESYQKNLPAAPIFPDTPPMGDLHYSSASEKEWEESANSLRCGAPGLTTREGDVLSSHPAFVTNPFTTSLFILPLFQSDANKHIIARVLKACDENLLPPHAMQFWVQEVLVWEPFSKWERVLNLMSSTASLWLIESLHQGGMSSVEDISGYPSANHPLWGWLRFFFARKSITIVLEEEVYTLVQLFLNLLRGEVINELPPVEVAISYTGKGYNAALRTALCRVVACVESWCDAPGPREKVLQRGMAVRHLNEIWRRCAYAEATDAALRALGNASEQQRWVILEAQLLKKYGVAVLKTFRSMTCDMSYLCDGARSFILHTMYTVNTATPSSSAAALELSLVSWATAAAICIREVGLSLTRDVCSRLVSEIRRCPGSAPRESGVLDFLTFVVQSMSEIRSPEAIQTCVNPRGPFRSTDAFITVVKNAIRERIHAIRVSRLGEDRPVNELLEAFSASNRKNDVVFQPHLFSFDGTPVVTLPREELTPLKNVTIQIDAYANEFSAFSGNQLREKGREAGRRMLSAPAESELAVLVACAREAVYRAQQKRPFRVQCMCVAAFLLPLCKPSTAKAAAAAIKSFKGRLAQVATGEGKSIIVSMTAAVYALMGQTVDVITSSAPLAARDAKDFKSFYELLGLRVSHIAVEHPTKLHFDAEVVYGTNTDFEFVELREGCFLQSTRYYDPLRTQAWVKRRKMVAIVDEADNLFLDAARNSARIAYPASQSFTWVYQPIFRLVKERCDRGRSMPSISEVRACLTSVQGGYYESLANQLPSQQLQKWVNAARVALLHRERNKHYVIRQEKVVIVDLGTGRLQESSRWSRGIHEMVEVKENIPVQPESGVIGAVSHPSFFDGYSTLLGITGTAGEPEERKEIISLYGIDTFDVPPHRPCKRTRLPTRVFRTKEEKFNAMVKEAMMKCKTTAVLILVPTIQDSNELVAKFRRAGLDSTSCLVFNETQKENEDFILMKASQVGTVVVATNNAGRGTDIRPSDEVLLRGGLHVMYGAFPTNLRVECQGLGRSARQGQPGSNQILVSLDETFVKELLPQSINSAMEETRIVEQLYTARTKSVREESLERLKETALERVRFATLQCFIQDYAWLQQQLKGDQNSLVKAAVERALTSSPRQLLRHLSVDEVLERLCECFRVLWVEYFTNLDEEDEVSDILKELPGVSNWSIDDAHQDCAGRAKAGVALYRHFLQSYHWTFSSVNSQNEMTAQDEEALECLESVIRDHEDLLATMGRESENKKM